MKLRLATCILAFQAFLAVAQTPCWFWAPISEQHVGFVGAASEFSVKPNGSLIASRKKALNAFASSYKLTLPFFKDDIFLKSNLEIQGFVIRFSEPFISDGALYSYALVDDGQNVSQQTTVDNWLEKKCEPQHCDFQRCSPSWLCDSSSEHLFGVSQMTAVPAKQLAKMTENATLFASYLERSQVENSTSRIESTGQNQNWKYVTSESEVTSFGHNQMLSNTQVCIGKNYLFGLFQRQGRLIESNKQFKQWRINPNLEKRTGVTGTFEGLTADGLFSTAVKLAIKNGLIELAKIKHVSINHEHQLSFFNGWYTLTKSTESTSATVSAVLMDIKVVEEDEKLVMFAWLLEI